MDSDSPTNRSKKPRRLKPGFEVSRVADVSVGYLPREDVDLMFSIPSGKCPFRHLRHEDGCGYVFWVANLGDFKKDCQDINDQLTEAGFSGTIVAILCEARRQGIQYVRFDVDGGEIKNAERAQKNED